MRYVQICERCGRVFPREDTVCPKCGFDKNSATKTESPAKRELTVSVDLQVSTHYHTCANCKLLIPKTQKKCPLCGCRTFRKYYYTIRKPSFKSPHYKSGTGRGYHGAACDICPVCYGTPDWCPLLD